MLTGITLSAIKVVKIFFFKYYSTAEKRFRVPYLIGKSRRLSYDPKETTIVELIGGSLSRNFTIGYFLSSSLYRILRTTFSVCDALFKKPRNLTPAVVLTSPRCVYRLTVKRNLHSVRRMSRFLFCQ